MLLSDLIDSYAAAKLALKESYLSQMRTAVNVYGRWLGHSPRLGDLTEESLAKCLSDYCRNHSRATTNSKRRAILTLWKFANKRRLTDLSPGDIPTVREHQRVPLAWSVAEFERLVAMARQWPGMVGDQPARLWWPALYLTCYDTSGRISALLSARTVNLSLAERCLLIEPEETKTGKASLYWLHDQTIAAIAAIHDPTRELLFPWPHCRRHLWRQCRKIVEAAGLQADKRGMSLFHKIRRTNLSYCAASSMELARQQAGHSDSRTTIGHYIDPRIARRQSAVDVLPRPKL